MAKFDLNSYETVEERLKKFWADNPNGRIDTQVVHITDDGSCVTIKAEVFPDAKEKVKVALLMQMHGWKTVRHLL
jgi:hypothetical protein